MGNQISIDKELTKLDDLLQIPVNIFKPPLNEARYSHYLKLWRFCQEGSEVNSKPVDLLEPQSFNSKECYLVFLIYRKDPTSKFFSYPQSMWGMMESLSNLTPRGLESVFTSDDSAVLDTFLLSKRDLVNQDLHYMLFVWNGKTAGPLLKAFTLTKGFELDKWLLKGKSILLNSLFLGVGIIGKKIQQFETITLECAFQDDTSMNKKPDCPVFLMQWLWPETPVTVGLPKPLFPKFRDMFLNTSEPALYVKAVQEKPIPKLNISVKEKVDLKPKIASLSLSNLKTREQERVQLQNLTKKELDSLDENFDVRETNRKDLKLQYYTEIISELDKGLYVGSYVVARDLAKLKATGITHVINCAANVCLNYYPDQFEYLHFFLKDSKTESIECVFYICLDFISKAIKSGGKVLVHCMQGVSRSVTICLAYIIWAHKKNFEEAFIEAKELRGICSPNTGFQVQLIWWYKRLFEEYDALPISLRVFAIASHSKEQPHTLIARLLTQPLYNPRDYFALDSRGIFIIQTPTTSYCWIGRTIPLSNKSKYLEIALSYYEYLKTNESAQKPLIRLEEGQETDTFWQLWNDPEPISTINEAWNHWFPDLSTVIDQEPQEFKSQEAEEIEEVKIDQKPRLYVYPELKGLGVFEDDELIETAFVCLCSPEKCFKWVGEFVRLKDNEVDEYIEKVTENYYGRSRVDVIDEEPGDESYEFLNYF